jgi:aminopeptidase 2
MNALFTWMTENWDELVRRLPANLFLSVFSTCTSDFSSFEKLASVQNFCSKRSTEGFDQVLAQCCDGIKFKAAWVERDRQDVKDWVNSYSPRSIKSELT